MYVCLKCLFTVHLHKKIMHKDNWMYYGNEKLCAKCHKKIQNSVSLFICSFIFRGGFFGSNVIGHWLFN